MKGFFFFYDMLGYRRFSEEKELRSAVLEKEGTEHFEQAENGVEGLLFFESKLQRTWLFATQENIFCVLDDVRKQQYEIRWTITKNYLQREFFLISTNLQDEFLQINPNYKEKSGQINFGKDHKKWLYSKRLYPNPDILKQDIYELIKKNLQIDLVPPKKNK
jgi:hypothetical protein